MLRGSWQQPGTVCRGRETLPGETHTYTHTGEQLCVSVVCSVFVCCADTRVCICMYVCTCVCTQDRSGRTERRVLPRTETLVPSTGAYTHKTTHIRQNLCAVPYTSQQAWHGHGCVCVCVCVQEILRYCTMDILEPAWRAMEERMRRANDLDEVCVCVCARARYTQPVIHTVTQPCMHTARARCRHLWCAFLSYG